MHTLPAQRASRADNRAPSRPRRTAPGAWFTLALALAACQSSTPKAEAPGEVTGDATADTPEAVFDRIIDAQLAAAPTLATALGEHRFDDRWPDLSDAGVAADQARIERDLAVLAELKRRDLSTDQRVDVAILEYQLQLQLLDHQQIRSFQHDPLIYPYMLGSGLDDLMARDFAPLDQRGQSLAARLEAMPAVIDDILVHLRRGPVMKPQTEVAIPQLDGVLHLIEKESRSHFAAAALEVRARIEAAIPAAAAAARELQRVLRDELLPTRATHPWRLGRELYAKKFALALATSMPIDQVLARAEDTKAGILADMATQARALHEPLFGKPAAQGADDGAIIRAVLEALAADHVAPHELRDAAEENLARLSEFVTEQRIITQDPSEIIQVIWTPEHLRGVAVAGLDQPGPLERTAKDLPSFYLVQPLPDEWDDAMRESYLREYNNFMLEVLSIHEAIPGHFVQLYYARREPSRVRKLYIDNPFAEGWAVYAEQVMMEHGYAGAALDPSAPRPPHLSPGLWRVETDPRLRAVAIALHRNKFWLRSTVNAIIDHRIHAGDLTEAQALRLLMDEAFQQEGEARKKWIRAQVTSTQLSSYFLGATTWLELRDQAKVRMGGSYDEAAFHEEALSHGSPPMELLPALMGW